jgi:mono/diheme cytochrome c family protein
MYQKILDCTLRSIVPLSLILFAGFALLMPGRSEEQTPKLSAKKIPVNESGEVSGSRLFHSYCATCHGPDGKGNGPAAPALKTAPPDLTILAKKNGNKFPAEHVMSVLANESDFPIHGSKEMPIWGPIFRRMGADQDLGRLRAHNVTEYLKAIQQR